MSVTGLEACTIAGYLQRMDLFECCGFGTNESFKRHDARGRFVAVREIDHRVADAGEDIATCLAPGGEDYGHPLAGLYDFISYTFTELGNNVRQHSRGVGYVAAQVNRTEGFVRVAIADNGRGIRQSFRDAGLAWSMGLDDQSAILKALEPEVSSKGSPSNEGVGLTLVSDLVAYAEGWLLICSGRGVYQRHAAKTPALSVLPGGASLPGTLIVMTFPQEGARNYEQLLQQAKSRNALLKEPRKGLKFKP